MALEQRDMQINCEKSKVMEITKNNPTRMNIKINALDLEQVKSYEYLGTIISSDGKIDAEIKNRTKKAMNIYHTINNTTIGKKELSQEAKMLIYNSVYVPTLTYGAESWTLTKYQEEKLNMPEMKYLRKVVGKTRRDKVRNNTIREEVGQTAIQNHIKKKELRWFGHLNRMDENRIPKKMFEARTEGTRGRGRPRLEWEKYLAEIAKEKGKSLPEVKKLSRDRKEYRKWTG